MNSEGLYSGQRPARAWPRRSESVKTHVEHQGSELAGERGGGNALGNDDGQARGRAGHAGALQATGKAANRRRAFP